MTQDGLNLERVHNMKKLPEEIHIKVDDKEGMVSTAKYVKAKMGDLKEFGYLRVTEEEVKVQLLKILNGEELDIIGMFMESDIVKEK